MTLYQWKMASLNSNLRVKNILCTPKDFIDTPGGTRTPGWDSLFYSQIVHTHI